MYILYVGDVMGSVGLALVERLLPDLRTKHALDLIIVQAENTTEGRGISLADFARLRAAGVDFCTGGNWSLYLPEIIPLMNDPAQPIIRPANYPAGTPGRGWKYAQTPAGKVLVISLLGNIVGRDADKPIDNPLQVVDKILDQQKDEPKVATIINFHGDYSSEKVIIGHYLDGRATLVAGDHWHVPTADARILPKGTAHLSDVGMCGALNASLGVSLSSVIPRWHEGKATRNVLETNGPKQFNAVLVHSDDATGLATGLEQIQLTVD